MATSKNYGKKKVRITSGIFWTLMGKNPIMEKSDAGAACLSWTFFFSIILSVTIPPNKCKPLGIFHSSPLFAARQPMAFNAFRFAEAEPHTQHSDTVPSTLFCSLAGWHPRLVGLSTGDDNYKSTNWRLSIIMIIITGDDHNNHYNYDYQLEMIHDHCPL